MEDLNHRLEAGRLRRAKATDFGGNPVEQGDAKNIKNSGSASAGQAGGNVWKHVKANLDY